MAKNDHYSIRNITSNIYINVFRADFRAFYSPNTNCTNNIYAFNSVKVTKGEYKMSTRAGIIITDQYKQKINFYRHSDGYPEGTMPTLERFLNLVKTDKIRADAMQASGWLVLIGHEEYKSLTLSQLEGDLKPKSYSAWKVGAYEPTTDVKNHCDLEYVYTVDLEKLKITVKKL